IARHGDGVIPDIVRGMEELQLLTAIGDEDLIAQIEFADSVDDLKTRAQELLAGGLQGTTQTEKSLVTKVNDHDQLYIAESGPLDFVITDEQAVRLEPGEAIIVPRQRLHGLSRG